MRTTATDKYLSLGEVAEVLGTSTQWVRRRVKSGELPAYKPGKEWRIREGDLNEFLETHSYPKGPALPSHREPTFNDVIAEEERRAKFGAPAQTLTLKNEAWLKLLDELPEPPDPQEFERGQAVIREMFDTIGASITGLKNYGILEDVQRLVEAEQAGTLVPAAFDEEVHLLNGELLVLLGRVIPKARNWYTRFEDKERLDAQLDSWAKQLERALAPLERRA